MTAIANVSRVPACLSSDGETGHKMVNIVVFFVDSLNRPNKAGLHVHPSIQK